MRSDTRSSIAGPLVVIGSGPAGLAAVRAFREHQPDEEVLLITADAHPPYARPPLTKEFLTGDSSLEDLWLTEEAWFDDHHVGLRLGCEAMDIDSAGRSLRLSDGTTQDFGQLVLATGSRPRPLPVPGGDDPELVMVRDLDSGIRLRRLAESKSRIVVLGSGFIGCEAAAALAGCGNDVVLVTRAALPHEARLGAEAGRRVAAWLAESGVEVWSGVTVERLSRSGSWWEISVGDGRRLGADAVISGSGVEPNVDLAVRAGLDLTDGAVLTDAGMRTSDSSIYAVGDIAYAQHATVGRRLRVEHWGDAEEQGTVAGRQAAGHPAQWQEVPGFWSTIGSHTLTYAAWGDGFDDYHVVPGPNDSWTVWYRSGELLSGVLAVGDEDAYERGRQQLRDRSLFHEAG